MNDHTEKPLRKQKRAPKQKTFASRDSFWNFPSSFEKWEGNFDQISKRKEKENTRVRIPPIPSAGYIHSLTDAYYGTQSPMVHYNPKPIPSNIITLTDGFGKSGFEAKRLKVRSKRDSGDYEKELSKNLDEQKKNILSSALNNIDFSKYKSHALPEVPKPQHIFKPASYDSEKYPYFDDPSIEKFSPLRYASHPREFPKKSGYGMEFYEKKDREMDCEPISVNLDNEPKENSTKDFDQQPGEKKRINKLGDKIQCLKIKYFGEDPLDSPFFKEDELKPKPKLQYHSSYEYKPNRTLDVFVQKPNDSNIASTQEQLHYEVIHQNQSRLIPVQENYIQYPALTTAAPIIMGMRPPPMKYQFLPLRILMLPPKPKPQKIMKTFKYRHNCLQPITKMTISERNDENVMYECNDVTLIRTTRDGNPHIQIIPRTHNRRTKLIIDESQDLRAGEVFENRRKKRSAETRRRLFPNKSLLDKLIKRQEKKPNSTVIDLGINSPEEVTEKAITTTTSLTPIFKIEPKPLPRLSGKDFLTRYHKTKSKNSKNQDFWNIGTEKPIQTQQPAPEDERPKKISRRLYSDQKQLKTKRDESGTTPVLLYVVDQTTGEGQWIRETTTEKPIKNLNIRRVFFTKKKGE